MPSETIRRVTDWTHTGNKTRGRRRDVLAGNGPPGEPDDDRERGYTAASAAGGCFLNTAKADSEGIGLSARCAISEGSGSRTYVWTKPCGASSAATSSTEIEYGGPATYHRKNWTTRAPTPRAMGKTSALTWPARARARGGALYIVSSERFGAKKETRDRALFSSAFFLYEKESNLNAPVARAVCRRERGDVRGPLLARERMQRAWKQKSKARAPRLFPRSFLRARDETPSLRARARARRERAGAWRGGSKRRRLLCQQRKVQSKMTSKSSTSGESAKKSPAPVAVYL